MEAFHVQGSGIGGDRLCMADNHTGNQLKRGGLFCRWCALGLVDLLKWKVSFDDTNIVYMRLE
jgi:hypothetical protein